jgi:hypothetical protein
MKITKKLTLFLFGCIAFVNLPTLCWYRDGSYYPSGAFTGAAIGGLAGGRKGAAIGLGVGMASDVIGSAAADDRRRRYYDEDDYYYPRYRYRYRKDRYYDLQRENEDLRDRLNKYEQE